MTIYGFRAKMAGKIVRAANQNARDNRGTKRGRDRWQETRSAEVHIAKVTTADPLTVDIYRGEGTNEKKVHAGVTDVQLNSDYTATVNQRLLAIKIRGTWELYMIVDGVSENFAADVFQVLGADAENKLRWNTPAIDLYLDSTNNDALTVKLTLGDSEYTASIGTCPPVEES